MEKAYTELQIKYEAVCQKSERMEVKNAMLEIRLQQQSNHSTMLRSQLDKLTEYTEKLLGESSEPTLHDYSSDLTSIFGEHSETHSPTADKLVGGGSSGFTYDVVKSRRQHRRGMDEECMSDSGTEDESFRKTSSLPPFHQSNGSCRYFSDMDLTTADLSSENERGSPAALDSLLNDQVDQLRQSLRLRNKTDADEPVSVIGSLDSMAVCPTNCRIDASRISLSREVPVLPDPSITRASRYNPAIDRASLAASGRASASTPPAAA